MRVILLCKVLVVEKCVCVDEIVAFLYAWDIRHNHTTHRVPKGRKKNENFYFTALHCGDRGTAGMCRRKRKDAIA